MSHSLLPSPQEASLLIVDIQERLLPAMPQDALPGLLKQVSNLIALQREFSGHIAYTEQYVRGLGPTEASLKAELDGANWLEKTEFSVMKNAAAPSLGLKKQVILVGMETHICVLLTALDLLAAGHQVFVPFDAVLSRHPSYRDNGLSLMEKAGAHLINTESLIFSTLVKAGSEPFKRFSARVK